MTARPRTPARRATSAALPFVLSALVLSGCGVLGSTSAEPSTTPSPTEQALPAGNPTDGLDVQGTGYSLTTPPGWEETTDEVQQRYHQVDASAGDTAVTGGFADNVNVIVSDKRRIKSQQKAERILARELRLVGRRVEVQEPGELDGEVAYHATARLKVGHLKVRTSQYFAKHGKTWYLVTFSYGPQTDEESEAEEVQSMLDSWSWQD
jgi:hypothetical protein